VRLSRRAEHGAGSSHLMEKFGSSMRNHLGKRALRRAWTETV
jgi:hypothetical protein